jgi:hypothetical protein
MPDKLRFALQGLTVLIVLSIYSQTAFAADVAKKCTSSKESGL